MRHSVKRLFLLSEVTLVASMMAFCIGYLVSRSQGSEPDLACFKSAITTLAWMPGLILYLVTLERFTWRDACLSFLFFPHSMLEPKRKPQLASQMLMFGVSHATILAFLAALPRIFWKYSGKEKPGPVDNQSEL